MRKVLSKKSIPVDTIFSYFREFSIEFDDVGIFNQKMQCFHMKHGLCDR